MVYQQVKLHALVLFLIPHLRLPSGLINKETRLLQIYDLRKQNPFWMLKNKLI